MAKTKISEFDSTPANNTDINGINIAEGCAPSGINNALRQMMANLKDMNIRSTITMLNTTEEDSDGGRANKIIFKGEQSGGEESVLGEIQASHDGTSDDQKGDLIFRTNDGSDGTSPTQVAKLDSAGNLLVGANESGIGSSASDTGVVLRGGIGYAEVTRDGGTVGRFNRLTSDGTIVDFAKDGTQVGSIVTGGGDLAIGTGTTSGMRFNDTLSNVLPYNVGGVAYSDNAIDLGYSTVRWKDLYLSGGVYLGGTTSSNELDDYEEGTFTPVLSDATSGGNNAGIGTLIGEYTKVGSLVYVTIVLGNINTSGMTSSNAIFVQGLPFSGKSTSSISQHLIIRADQINVNSDCYGITGIIGNNGTTIQMNENRDSTNDTALTVSKIINQSSDILLSGTYKSN